MTYIKLSPKKANLSSLYKTILASTSLSFSGSTVFSITPSASYLSPAAAPVSAALAPGAFSSAGASSFLTF